MRSADVPWSGNMMKASLWKDQDHGIAMIFGLKGEQASEG